MTTETIGLGVLIVMAIAMFVILLTAPDNDDPIGW